MLEDSRTSSTFGFLASQLSSLLATGFGQVADTRTLTPDTLDLPDDFFAVEGFGQIKILAFSKVLATLP
jgi:hypothetical protein